MIVDTNALSAYADGEPGAIRAVDSAASIEIPVIALGEFEFGIAGSRRASAYGQWLAQFLALTTMLDITEHTAKQYAAARAELRTAGRPIPANDLWIAALARQHRLPVLSQDRHFDAVKGIRRVSW